MYTGNFKFLFDKIVIENTTINKDTKVDEVFN